ncbi:MAG: histidine phosphatase family protein [Steroidobacteraceae bacterium]
MAVRRWMRSVLRNGFVCATLALSAASSLAAESAGNFDRTIYLVRHGSYASDPSAKPDVGPPLTALGISQARLVASRFRELPLHIDSITSSKMLRAMQTAAVIRESLPGVATGSSALISECTPPALVKLSNEPAARLDACKQRLDAAFAQFFVPANAAEKNDVLVCHGNVIRYLVTRALGIDTRAWFNMTVAHASVTVVRVFADGSIKVLAVGDTGHVPPTLQSWGTDADPQLDPPSVAAF